MFDQLVDQEKVDSWLAVSNVLGKTVPKETFWGCSGLLDSFHGSQHLQMNNENKDYGAFFLKI